MINRFKRYTKSILFSLAIILPMAACHNANDTETVVGKTKIPAILKGNDTAGSPDERLMIKKSYDKAIEELKANPDAPKSYLSLAAIYVTIGRITGNGGYYSNAALNVLGKVLDNESSTQDQRFQALSLKSAVLMNMHQFKDALAVANDGLNISAYNSGLWGAIVDAQVELGHYKEAVEASDKMLSLRPDLRSYSRASYLRQIYGDNPGAIEAMKMAVESGVPGLETTEWARVQLGDLYYNTGNVDSAKLLYRMSLVYRPNYPYANMGMARAERARQEWDTAIGSTKLAIRVMSESSFIAYLADLYEMKGDAAKSAEVRKDVLRLLKEAQDKEPKDAAVKHNGAREMAAAYLHTGDLDKAQEWAKKDYDMRPDNIDANDLMAWIAYKRKDYTAAKGYAEKNAHNQYQECGNPLQRRHHIFCGR